MISTAPPVRGGLAGLPPFLRLLTAFPGIDTVMEGLVAGPLARFGVRTCRLWVVRDDALVAVAGHGHTPEEADRYAVLPAQLDLAIWRAVRTGRPIVTAGDERPSTEFGSIDEQFWSRVLARVDAQSVVRAPLLLGDTSVGAMGVITDRPWPDDATSAATLDALSRALGLWIGNPRSGADERAAQTLARTSQLPLAFTPRQRQVLQLVESGATNPEIALQLSVSVSVVKQDLQGAMKALSTSSRHEAPVRARELGLL